MLLQKLVEYANIRMKDTLPPRLYRAKAVRYIIDLDGDGHLLNPHPTDTADKNSKQNRRGIPRLLPDRQRAVGIVPFLLADKADYVLGYVNPDGKPDRVASCHNAFLELLDRCVLSTNEKAVMAVRSFLEANALSQLELPEDFDAGATIAFRVDDVFPTDIPIVQVFWASVNDPAAKGAQVMQCLVCGVEQPVLERLDEKVKGVPGGQMAGTSIISANNDAFESYGLKASYIAPTCSNCGERFTKAINHLLADEGSHTRLGGAAFFWWTREYVDFPVRSFLDDPDPEAVRLLMNSVRTGKPVAESDHTKFYASSLSGSGGRAVVRDWIDTTVWDVKRSLDRWFQRQQIVDANHDEMRPYGLYALAAATVRDPRKELAPPTPRALLHAALTGTPVPTGLLYQAVRRNRAEQGVTRPRAALIKLVLLSQQLNPQEGAMVQLDPANDNAAYRCGRLLAVLEQVQRAALGDINATIVDRFYGTASSAPASVFGRLLRGAQPHLSKLDRDRPGAHYALQTRMEEIMRPLEGFPRTLGLQDQGLFALGYYHQRADDRAQARANAENRRNNAASQA